MTWIEAGVIIPRVMWAYEILSLDGYLPEHHNSESLQIRLRWTANHKIDFVGLDTNRVHSFNVYDLPISAAWHSTDGNVYDNLRYSDDIYSELMPGQKLYLYFNQLGIDKSSVDYVIIVEGRYYTLV